METATLYELIGYIASLLIVISLLMASVLKLRVINLVGAIVFTAYGLLIGSLPVALTNGAIVIIDLYHLVRLARARSSGIFEAVPVVPSSALLQRFVEHHLDDIRRFQPEVTGVRDDHLGWFVLRDAVPVGVVLATPPEDGHARIEVDYVTPSHRDLRAGSAFFEDVDNFDRHGITSVEATAATKEHRRYLERMGFTADGDRFVRSVAPAGTAPSS